MGDLSSRIKNSIIVFLILSVIVHLSTLGVVNFTVGSTNLQVAKQNKIEIEVIDVPADKKMKLVEQDEKRANDETPKDAKYLSRHNQTVIEETRAANFGDFKNSQGGAQSTKAERKIAQKTKSNKTAATDGTMPSLSALNPQFDFSESRQTTTVQNDDAGAPSATNDHLKELKPSMETMLSSKEFVYYTYYQRIRSQIRQHWEPSIREKVRRIFAQGRSIASTRDHVTRVVIILNPVGELIGVQIIGQSGVKDLDDAAVEAFRAAQPFPNPPKGIVDTDGTIKINWDFILES